MASVWFVSPAWRRFSVTRLALAQRRWLCDELAARGLTANGVIVADDENLEIAAEFGFATVELGNEYLGARFNAGIEYACVEGGADFIVHIGSDDWAHPDLFKKLPATVAGPPELTADSPVVFWDGSPEALTGWEITIVDLRVGRMQRCRVRGRYGVIPWVLPRKLLEPSGFRPIHDRLNRGIDGSLIAVMRVRPTWVFHDPHPLCRVDFKSEMNLTPYPGLAANLGVGAEVDDPWSALAEQYPADLVELARATHMEMATAVAA